MAQSPGFFPSTIYISITFSNTEIKFSSDCWTFQYCKMILLILFVILLHRPFIVSISGDIHYVMRFLAKMLKLLALFIVKFSFFRRGFHCISRANPNFFFKNCLLSQFCWFKVEKCKFICFKPLLRFYDLIFPKPIQCTCLLLIYLMVFLPIFKVTLYYYI